MVCAKKKIILLLLTFCVNFYPASNAWNNENISLPIVDDGQLHATIAAEYIQYRASLPTVQDISENNTSFTKRYMFAAEFEKLLACVRQKIGIKRTEPDCTAVTKIAPRPPRYLPPPKKRKGCLPSKLDFDALCVVQKKLIDLTVLEISAVPEETITNSADAILDKILKTNRAKKNVKASH